MGEINIRKIFLFATLPFVAASHSNLFILTVLAAAAAATVVPVVVSTAAAAVAAAASIVAGDDDDSGVFQALTFQGQVCCSC